jgi:predicted metal-dependent phosphoesterase TrpH
MRWSAVSILVVLVLHGAFEAAAGVWLKGDLHCHSLYSDGDSPVADILASARDRGLDFLALTDHDSYMEGVPEHWSDPDYVADDMILLYGMEWTNFRGHANVWLHEPFDYSGLWAANLAGDPDAAVAAAHAQGALFSANHPARINWDYPVVDGMDALEVWNGPMLINNNQVATHDIWDYELRQGRRITGVGGSDTHHLVNWMAPYTGHGNPTTWVYTDTPDAIGILAAVAEGHVTLSFTAAAPRLELTADVDGNGQFETMVGDNIAGNDCPVRFRLSLAGVDGGAGGIIKFPDELVDRLGRDRLTFWDYLWIFFQLQMIRPRDNTQLLGVLQDGRLDQAWFISGGTDEVFFTERVPATGRTFYRAELYGDTQMSDFINRIIYGRRTAMTNPIYVNYE